MSPCVPSVAQARSADTAALQVALRAKHAYSGTVDGIRGPMTREGVRRFQQRRGLVADGIAGPATRAALGWRGRPKLGRRVIGPGAKGWDVAALQWLLATRGFPHPDCAPALPGLGRPRRRRPRRTGDDPRRPPATAPVAAGLRRPDQRPDRQRLRTARGRDAHRP